MDEIIEFYNAFMRIGLSRAEVKNKIERGKKKSSDLLPIEFILFKMAKEMELFEDVYENDEVIVNISDINKNLNDLVLIGIVKRLSKVKNFTRKGGMNGLISSFFLVDDTGEINVVLWDDSTKIIEIPYFKNGALIKISGGHVKRGMRGTLEVHLQEDNKIIILPESDKSKFFQKEESMKIIPISSLFSEESSFIDKCICGIITKMNKIALVRKKDGTFTLSFRFLLADESGLIDVNAWSDRAVELVKSLDIGKKFRLCNYKLFLSAYSGRKEITILKNSKTSIF